LANYAGSDAVRGALDTARRAVYPETRALRIEVEAAEAMPGEAPSDLITEVENDPDVALVRRIIGGEIVAARPDGSG
jgi:hypothetical protein